MATITVKNIPPEIYEKIKQSAALNRRSINSEIIACLERVFSSQPADPEVWLATARRLREQTAVYIASDDDLKQAKEEGRP